MEANGSADGSDTPPDLKETYNCGAQTPTGDPVVDTAWFPPNVWPAEVPELDELFTEYCRQMKLLSDDLLALMSASGSGGLQVYTREGGWADAPYHPEALTINIGDLIDYWTGGRWPAGRHRVLPPQAHAPDEDLMSLIFFYELDHDAVVTPLGPPVGAATGQPPVVAGEFIMSRLEAITVTAS